MEKLEVFDVKVKVCGICGEESDNTFYISPDGSEYKDTRMCMLYEVLCTRQGFYMCKPCKNLISSCSNKIVEVCRSRRLYNVTNKRGCFLCGVNYNTRVFKTQNKELEEKVLRRFKRQHQFKTVYTDTICNNCKLMFTELVKLQTTLHDNIENCELKALKKHPLLKSKKVQPVGNDFSGESTTTEQETVTFSEQATSMSAPSHDNQCTTFNQAKEIPREAIVRGLTKKVRVPSAPSNKFPANKVLFRSVSNLEDGRTRRTSNVVDDRTGNCSGDFDIPSRKRVSFNDPLVLTSPPPSSPKITQTMLKSILKKGSTFETHLPCKGIRIPIDFSKIANYRAPRLMNFIKTTHRSPRFYNPIDLPPRRVSEIRDRVNVCENDSSSQLSFLDVGTQVVNYFTDSGERANLSDSSEDEVPQMANCLPENKEPEQITPNLSIISETDEQIEVGDITVPQLTNTIDSTGIEEVVDNVNDISIPVNQVMDDGSDLPKTASDFGCGIMINQPSQISDEQDFSENLYCVESHQQEGDSNQDHTLDLYNN